MMICKQSCGNITICLVVWLLSNSASCRKRSDNEKAMRGMRESANPEDPARSQRQPAWRKWLFIATSILVCLALGTAYFIVSWNKELQDAIAEADGQDPGWRFPDLQEKRTLIPDEHNSALMLMTAKGL